MILVPRFDDKDMQMGIGRFAYNNNGILLRTRPELTTLLNVTAPRTISSGYVGLDRLATLGY